MGKRRKAFFPTSGIKIEQVGRHVLVQGSRSREEHVELQKKLVEWRKRLPEEVSGLATKLDEILGTYDSFDVIAATFMHEFFADPETFKEYSHPGRAAYAEYIALRCLSHPYNRAEGRPSPFERFIELRALLEQIFSAGVWYHAAEAADPGHPGPPSAIAQLRFQIINEQISVRTPWYLHHRYDFLRTLFAPFDEWFASTVGCSMTESIRFSEQLPGFLSSRFEIRRQQAFALEREFKRAFRRSRVRPPQLQSRQRAKRLRRTAIQSEKKALRRIRHAVLSQVLSRLGEVLSFSAVELAEACGGNPNSAEAFLKLFSVDFGTEAAEPLPQPVHKLHTYPIVHHGGRFLPAGLALLSAAIQFRAEDLLNPDSKLSANQDPSLWERYVRHRKTLVEKQALQLLGNALKTSEVYHSLRYRFQEDGAAKEAELDGLVAYDSALIVVEAKAGGLTEAARRGGPRRLVRDLGKLVAEAHSQGTRATKYISEAPVCTFRLSDDSIVTVDKSRFKHIFQITVTLDPLGSFTANMAELSELGIFKPGDLPWAVSLPDLRVISELTEFPCMLIHYLLRRSKLNTTRRLKADDELDWFAYYLKEGLYVEGMILRDFETLTLMSHTTPLDDYYFYKAGLRSTPAPKPTQEMPGVMRQILAKFTADGQPGHLAACLTLLDMGSKARSKFASLLNRACLQARGDKNIHDFTMPFGESRTGLNVMVAPQDAVGQLGSRLRAYGELKKYQLGCDTWVGLGFVAGTGPLLHCWVVGDAPWQVDDQLQKLVQENLPSEGKLRKRAQLSPKAKPTAPVEPPDNLV